MKQMRFALMIISAIVWVAMPATAQDLQTISVTLVSVPSGADVTLNGEWVGVAPLTLDVAPGVYQVSFSLAGFREWSDNAMLVIPQQKVWAYLQGGDSLTQIAYPAASSTWSNHRLQFRFRPYLGENVETTYVTWDLETGAITRDSLPLDLLEDDALRSQLGIQSNAGTIIEAYTSPSGRYVVFPERTGEIDRWSNLEEWELKIYDWETDTIYGTRYTVLDPIARIGDPTFQLFWSADESFVGIDSSTGRVTRGARIYLSLEGSQVEMIGLHSFTADTGETMYAEDIISPPSNQGQVLVYNVITPPETTKRELWLVDLPSLTGVRFPLESVYDVGFLPEDNESIIVAHPGGISRMNVHDLTRSELITDVISARWDVYAVEFSPTAEYAWVSAGRDSIPTRWLYKLPQH